MWQCGHRTLSTRAAALEGLILEIKGNAGEEGKLFGSVGTVDIAEASNAAGHEIERSEVRLPEGPLRVTGEHDVEIHLATDLNVTIKVKVVGETGAVNLLEEAPAEDSEATDSSSEATDSSTDE